MDDTFVKFVTAIIAGGLTYLGVRLTAKMGARTTREGLAQEALQWRFDQLQEEVTRQGQRIAEQDKRIEDLDNKLDESNRLSRKAINFIDRVGLANYYGQKLPIPDGVLTEHVDMALWPPDNP